MANVSRISGFKPVKSLAGGAWTALIRQYDADAAKSAAIFIGDPVTLAADGNVEAAASGDTILGVVVAVGLENTLFENSSGYFDPDNLGKRYLAAAEAGVVGVVPAEMSIFEVYSDSGDDLDLNLGDSRDFKVGAGSTTTGNSAYTIDSTTTNNDVKVVEQVTRPDNDPTLADAAYIVKFNTTENALD